MPYGCHASGYKPYAVEGRSMVAVTHLALLGVKIQDSAFRVIQKKKQSHHAAAFAMIEVWNGAGIGPEYSIDESIRLGKGRDEKSGPE